MTDIERAEVVPKHVDPSIAYAMMDPVASRDIEQRLVHAVRTVAKRSVESLQVARGLAAAESIPVGIVWTSEDAAAAGADAMRTIIDGEKKLAADLADILRIPNAMIAAARTAMEVERVVLKATRERGNDARVAYQALLRRRAAEVEARDRAAARQAAEAAAVQAAEMGEADVPPEAEIAPVQVPRTVAAGSAKSGTMIRMRAVEVVDWSAVPHEWLRLDSAIALAAFTADRVEKPEPGESVIHRGVKYEAVESAVNRR